MSTMNSQPNKSEDNFFTPIQNTKPYLKIAAQGFAGSGKTYTLAQIAIGLHKKIKSTKPIVVFDTEESSKFLLPFFNKHKIQAVNKRSRSLADLKETFKRCREGYSDILLIDSISHVWESFLEAYKQKKNRTRLEFQDWGIIKPAWKNEFSDPFVRDPYHCLMTGRAGYEYESEINEETKKREIYKSGVKMKVEGETAYEPDILLYMERFEHILDEKKEVYRQATILKDRSTLIDGKVFKNPSFKDFLPAINIILNDAVQEATPIIEGDASQLFKTEQEKVLAMSVSIGQEFDPQNEAIKNGKYAGTMWMDVPVDYLDWASKNTNGEGQIKAKATIAWLAQRPESVQGSTAHSGNVVDEMFPGPKETAPLYDIIESELNEVALTYDVEKIIAWGTKRKAEIQTLEKKIQAALSKSFRAAVDQAKEATKKGEFFHA